MRPDTIRRRLQATPFRAFELHLTSGTVVRVPHQDFAFMPPKPDDDEIVVFDREERFHIIPIDHVACLKQITQAKTKAKT